MYKRHDIDVNAWNDPMFFSQSDLVQARRLFLGDRMGEGSEGHEAVRSAFDRFDVDQTGSISRDELGGRVVLNVLAIITALQYLTT